MRSWEPRLDERVVLVATALSAAKIPFAFGGALALAYHGVPRVTVDIDLNVFVPRRNAERVLRVLKPLGIQAGRSATATLNTDGQCRLRWEPYTLDIFLSVNEFHDSCAERVRSVPFLDETIPILSAEDLVTFKALYDRPKDWLDIEQLLFAQAGTFDVGYVEEWLDRLVGSGDERVAKFASSIARVSGESDAT